MKVLTLLASPRSDGNTERLLDWTERALSDWGHEITRLHIGRMAISGCKSCFACAESANEPGCVMMDDAQDVFSKMLEADAILYATPMYMWSYAAQLKALLDRHVCLVRGFQTEEYRSFVENKRTALLVSCAGPENGNADLIKDLFPRIAEYVKYDNRGVWVFPLCTDVNMLPNSHGGISRELARTLVE